MPRVSTRTKQGTGGAVTLGAEGKETVVATLEGVTTTKENGIVQLDGLVPCTTVAEDTEIVVRIRRNSLTGTLVVKNTTKPGASAIVDISVQAEDEPGEVVSMSYVLTMESVAKKLSKSEAATLQAAW